MLVDHDVDDHLVLLTQVLALAHIAGGLFETLGSEVLLHDLLNATCDIGSDLVTRLQAQLFLKVFALTAFHTHIVDFADTWLLAQVKHEPSLVLIDFRHLDLHLVEQTLPPKALGGSLEVVARDFDALPHR